MTPSENRRFQFLFLLVLALASSTAVDAATLRPIALSGQRAPGTGDGITFFSFGSFDDPNLPAPQIDQQGRVLFFAFVNGPGVDGTNHHGLWLFDGTATALIARAGDPAPGTSARFASVPNDIVPVGSDVNEGISTTPATLSGSDVDFFNDAGIWRGTAGALQLVLREGDQAPGTGAAFFSPGLADSTAAGVLVSSSLQGAGIHSGNDESVWSRRGAASVLHAREGSPAPGTNLLFGPGSLGAGPSTFPSMDMNDAGQVLLRGNLSGSGVDAYNDEALFIDRGTGLQLYLREGDPAPGAGRRVTFGGSSVELFIIFPMINSHGHVAFPVRLGGRRGKIPTTDALYSDHTGSLRPIAIGGQPAPGTAGNWTVLFPPFLSDGPHVAFMGSAETGFRPRSGIFWDQPGTVTPVILPDAPAPERPGFTFHEAMPIAGYNAAGFLVFTALLTSESSSSTAILSVEPDGTLHTIVAVGDLVDVSGSGEDLRRVSFVRAGELSAGGTFVLRLSFTDGSSGVFTVRLPGA